MANLGADGAMHLDTPLFKSSAASEPRPILSRVLHEQTVETDRLDREQGENDAEELQNRRSEENTTPNWSKRSAVPIPEAKQSDAARVRTSNASQHLPEEEVLTDSSRWIVKRYSRGEVYVGQTGRRREHKGVGLLRIGPTHGFVGEWQDDRYQGCGVLQTTAQSFHLGMFSKSQTEGPGLLVQPEMKFLGSFRAGLREGAGEEISLSRKLRGYWLTGLLDGFGELESTNFRRQGYWVQGVSEGQCIETQGDCQFIGTLHKGLKHGPGVLFKGGSVLSAVVYWRGQADGYAQIREHELQTFFEGILVQGVKEGPATTTNSLGKEQLFAEYSGDQLHGIVLRAKSANQKEFLGYYKHGKPDGLCLEKGAGWCYFGHYKDGIRHGWAYENKSGREFTGRYVQGKQHGLALLQLPGVQAVGGEFQGGKLVGFSQGKAPLEFREELPALEDYVKKLHHRIAHLRLTLQEAKNKWSLPPIEAIRTKFEAESQKLAALMKSTRKNVSKVRDVVHGQLKWVQHITKDSTVELGIESLFRGLRLSDPNENNLSIFGDLSAIDIPLEALGMPVVETNHDASQTHFSKWQGSNKVLRSPEAPLNKSISAVMAQNPNASLAEWMDVFTLDAHDAETKDFQHKRLEEIFPPRSPEKREAQTGDIILDEDYLAREEDASMLHMREIPGREFDEGVSFFRIEAPGSSSRQASQQAESAKRNKGSKDSPQEQELIEISDMGDLQESNKSSLENSPDLQPISIHVIQQPLKSIPEEAAEDGSEHREKGFNTVSQFGTGPSDLETDPKRNPLLLFKRDLKLYSKIIDDIKLTPRQPGKFEYKHRLAPMWARESYPELGEKSGSSFSMMSNQVDFQIEDINPQLLETSQDSADALFQAFNEET